jgi:hypothetical protein
MDVFIDHMAKLEERIVDIYHNSKSMTLPDEKCDIFRTATHCSICNKEFEDHETLVQDHCHVIGRFRGTANGSCKCKQRERVPVFFHNQKGYDAHHIIGK